MTIKQLLAKEKQEERRWKIGGIIGVGLYVTYASVLILIHTHFT